MKNHVKQKSCDKEETKEPCDNLILANVKIKEINKLKCNNKG
jgi:hypothetical protein